MSVIKFPLLAFIILFVISVFNPNKANGLDQPEHFFKDAKHLLKSGDYQGAIQSLSKALGSLALNNEFSRTALLARAQAYYEKGDLNSAFRDLNEVLGHEGLSGETLASCMNLRALLNLKQGKMSRALEDLNKAVNVPHENKSLKSVAFGNRGITLMNMGSYLKALKDFDRAIEYDPKSSFNYAARAVANLRTDRIEEARKDSELAMSLEPDRQSLRFVNSVLDEINFEKIGENCVVTKVNDEGQIFVQIKFSKNGRAHRFLLDTGATHSLIDKSLLNEVARETKVRENGKGMVNLADGSTLPVTKYYVENAYLYQMQLGPIQVQTMDRKTKKSFNLLGAGSLKNLSILIDTSNRRVEIRKKAPLENQARRLLQYQ